MPSKSIKSMVNDINNREADGGGLWLPNIQREFVWEEEQIERLFDSIMRQYPLASLLLWKTKDEVKHRQFIQNYNNNKVNLKHHYQNNNTQLKRLVLDGQQRLQSLYLGLKGSIDARTLHFDILSGDVQLKDDIRYHFSFRNPKTSQWPWVEFRELVWTKKLASQILPELEKKYNINIPQEDKDKATLNLERIRIEFSEEKLLYQEIDNSYGDSDLLFEDIVEIFIRANSGGTTLSKSDLMFSLLTTDWTDADIIFEDFLEEINDNGRFRFTRDFLIKLSTSLLGHGAKYNVELLRADTVRKEISQNWEKISESLLFVKDEVVQKTYIRSDKAMISYNALIPLVYAHYHSPETWGDAKFISKYLIRTLLGGAFSGQPDSLIDRLTAAIDLNPEFKLELIFKEIQDYGRNLEISENMLLHKCGYGSSQIHLLFNLWYGNVYNPSSIKNEPQIDHIFAKDILKSEKVVNPNSGRLVQKYSMQEINQLANCMLLPAHVNGAGDKGSKALNIWLEGRNDDFLELHLIPKDKTLWAPNKFEEFIEERKKLILNKFKQMNLLNDDEQ